MCREDEEATIKLGDIVCACNPSTQEAEAGKSAVPGQSGQPLYDLHLF
jgi:hypothetical protein